MKLPEFKRIEELMETWFLPILSGELGNKAHPPAINSNTIGSGNRIISVWLPDDDRFVINFWESGIELGRSNFPQISEGVLSMVNDWLDTEETLTELRGRYNEIELREVTPYFENGCEIDWQWKYRLDLIRSEIVGLIEFAEMAEKDEILRHLTPYTSLDTFRFSRCTGYPFTYDCPYVRSNKQGVYEVYAHEPDGRFLGRGNATEAVETVKRNLAPGTVKAVRGTNESFIS